MGKPDPLITPHSLFVEFIGGQVSESINVDRDVVRGANRNDVMKLEPSILYSDTGVKGGRSVYRELCAEVLDCKILTQIRQGTEKGLGIGKADFLFKVASLC